MLSPASNPDDYVMALPPSGFREVFWKKLQIVNPVTIVLADRAKNILRALNGIKPGVEKGTYIQTSNKD